jgi:thiol-disulfide isomerase/thioredoxin
MMRATKASATRSTRSTLVVAVLVALGLLLVGCGSATEATDSGSADDRADETTQTDAATPPASGSPSKGAQKSPRGTPSAVAVPETLQFAGTTVDGAAYDGSALAGRPAVLWFWAPWCPTCRGQAPTVSALAEEYGDQVGFVGVGSLDDGDAIADFAGDVPGLVHLTDPDGEVWRHFAIAEQSVYVVLDADGEVVSDGYLADDELTDLVAGLA